MGEQKTPGNSRMINLLDLPYKSKLNERNITNLYDRLGLEWSTFTLGWDNESGKKTMKGACKDRQRKNVAGESGLHIWLDTCDAEIIDIDGDSPEARQIIKLALTHCRMIVETRKGYHLYFKNQNNFERQINDKLHIDLLTPNGTTPMVILAPPSRYIIPGDNPKVPSKMVTYTFLTYPDDGEELAPMNDTLISYLTGLGFYAPGQKPAPTPKVYDPPTRDPTETNSIISDSSTAPSNFENLNHLCDCLKPEWLKETGNWLKLGYCLKTINNDEATKELFLLTSARAPGYDGDRFKERNAKMWDEIRPSGRITIGSLKHWAKICDPGKYFNIARRDYLRLLTSSPIGPTSTQICELFTNEMAGDIVYSTSDKDFYIYDPATTLWKGGSGVRAIINQIFVDTLQRVIIKVMEGLFIVEGDGQHRENMIKTLKAVDGNNAVAMVSNYLPVFCLPPNGIDPLTYFNQNPDLLPLANGVWKFSEKRLVSYEREHFFTHKIDIKYKPDADTSLINRAMAGWFKNEKPTMEFIQYMIGYCLTGFTTRQEFYVAWGSEAGNGKSLLWGEILPSLLGDKYYARITSDAFADTGNPNNDQLYYLNGIRYAFMSEPRKGAKNGIDNELLKTITGDKEFTAQAKYKNKLTFKLLAKILCACNDLPEFNCDDKGTMRRFVPFLQNVSCLDREDYEKAPEALRADGSVILKDDEFVKALVADREGNLRWALEGASRYIDSPRLEPPEAMKNAKLKARETIDTLTAWLSGCLEKGERPLAYTTLKGEWKMKGLDFQQTKKGFAVRLTNKLKMLGWTVDEGRAGKSEERIINCRLVPDKFDGQID